jgi:hypothetical protein
MSTEYTVHVGRMALNTCFHNWCPVLMATPLGVKPLIHQSELRTYTKVVPFQGKSSFHFVVLWKLLNGMEWFKLIIEVKYIRLHDL